MNRNVARSTTSPAGVSARHCNEFWLADLVLGGPRRDVTDVVCGDRDRYPYRFRNFLTSKNTIGDESVAGKASFEKLLRCFPEKAMRRLFDILNWNSSIRDVSTGFRVRIRQQQRRIVVRKVLHFVSGSQIGRYGEPALITFWTSLDFKYPLIGDDIRPTIDAPS